MTVDPFLRWAGGKRWLASRIAPVVRERLSRTYREPFLGAGSLFFAVEPVRAVLSDVNGDLIEAWQQIRHCPNELLKELRQIPLDSNILSVSRLETPLPV